MNLENRKRAFISFGNALKRLNPDEKEQLIRNTCLENTWFTPDSVELALQGIIRYLDEENLNKWLSNYQLKDELSTTKIGVVMAGNIPAVGFHDFLSVLISGHILLAKLSSKDSVLLRYLATELTEIAPEFKTQIQFPPLLKEADAFIATGSDNSSRYFEYYFSKKPHIIRKNRIGVGILNGKENEEDFKNLAQDILSYFGLGCRNVAKLYVPKDYSFVGFYDAIEEFKHVLNSHKYQNNYDYSKAIYLVKAIPHLDNGFLLLTEETAMASPTAVVFYEYYDNEKDLENNLKQQEDKIQCIVSRGAWYPDSFHFGEAQKPNLWNYADQIDTLKFLSQL